MRTFETHVCDIATSQAQLHIGVAGMEPAVAVLNVPCHIKVGLSDEQSDTWCACVPSAYDAMGRRVQGRWRATVEGFIRGE